MRVADLTVALGVSTATVRRDLTALEAEGAVVRAHGTVRLRHGPRDELGFAEREQENLGAKRAIASCALAPVQSGETLFLDAGTTVLQLAHCLRLYPRRLTIFTNGIDIAAALDDVADVEVHVIGGRMRAANRSMVGPMAEAALETIWVDRLFLGASALCAAGRLTSFDLAEAHLNAAMMRRAAQVVVLADASKLDRRATYAVGALGRGHTLVTDISTDGALPALLREQGCRVIRAAPLTNPSLRKG